MYILKNSSMCCKGVFKYLIPLRFSFLLEFINKYLKWNLFSPLD